jgi:hypothetical protein
VAHGAAPGGPGVRHSARVPSRLRGMVPGTPAASPCR